MRVTTVGSVSILLVIQLLFYVPIGAQVQSPDTDIQEENENWIKEHAVSIDTLKPDGVPDLGFLKRVIGNRRIVQLGESGHGTGQFTEAKARIIKYLHSEMGFEVVAFESSFYQCYRSDRFIGEWDAKRLLYGCVYGVWHTKEMLELFEYIKSSSANNRPMRFVGFDIQPIGPNKKSRPDFLRNVVFQFDPEYAKEIFELDSFFLVEYGKKSKERRDSFREHREKFLNGYQGLAAFVEKHYASIAGKADANEALAALQTARSMSQYIKMQTAQDVKERFEIRDKGMADNLEFIAEKLYPDKKILVWGHNAHIRYKNEGIKATDEIYPSVPTRHMGSWLKEKYKDNIYTVGFYAFRGTAANNSRKVYEIRDAEKGTVENLLNAAKGNHVFVDISEQKNQRGTGWMFEPRFARYNGQHKQSMIVSDQYDGIWLIKNVSPPTYLY